MLNVPRLSCARSVLFCLLVASAGSTAKAQVSQNPALDKQLSRLDLGVSAVGILNSDSSGTAVVEAVPTTVSLHPGNTVGALVTVRYTVKPLIGFEFNYGYARYTDTFTPLGILNPPSSGGVQQNAAEYTFGYVAHAPKKYYGINPFIAVGAGTTDFRPTPGGGLGYLPQARATYYYSIGAEALVSTHFGVRAQFREAFFKAPDFETNYLTIQQHTTTLEPGFGFFLRF
jgi:Outer membrane protein beta-barrel domain